LKRAHRQRVRLLGEVRAEGVGAGEVDAVAEAASASALRAKKTMTMLVVARIITIIRIMPSDKL
jgi:hypothetical protein